MKKSFWFGMAAGAALLVVVALIAISVSPGPRVLASSLSGNGPVGGLPWAHMGQHGGWPGSGAGFTLPPELQGLITIPADQRFSHLEGVQVNLKDQNNQPLVIHVIPGKVTASNATSLTIAANSGETQTFTLNSQTIIHAGAAGPAPTGTPAAAPSAASLKNGDSVVVVTLNNSDTATAVIDGGPAGFAGSGHGGWWNRSAKGQ